MGIILDIGGEGRHARAWNINPSRVKTIGAQAGKRIPRLVVARAESLPFADGTVQGVLVERAPLSHAAVLEIVRIVAEEAWVILRHVPLPGRDRHELASSVLRGTTQRRMRRIGGQVVQETRIRIARRHGGSPRVLLN